MVNDSLEIRMWSWCLLFGSYVWFVIFTIFFVATLWIEKPWTFVSFFVLGLLVGFFQVDFVRRFENWAERKLSSLLDEKVWLWMQIKERTTNSFFMVLGITVAFTLLLSY